MGKSILFLPGDGIGPEVAEAAKKVLLAAAGLYNLSLEIEEMPIGGCAIDAVGTPLPSDTLSRAQKADAVFLGAVGGTKWDALSGDKRPEAGLLGLRSGLGVYANLRPALVHKALSAASPLKPSIIQEGLDVLIVRELTGGIYFGDHGRETLDHMEYAYDVERYSVAEIQRVAHVAFQAARRRNQRLCSVDKANVLESSRLWRETVTRVHEAYPDVALSHLYVDNAAMQLVRAPQQFDVLLTSNLFGDILSDEASMLTGSIGMLPSASLGSGTAGLYEPIHGSAPDIAGQGIANPLAAILSIALMLRYSLEAPEAAEAIEKAVSCVLDEGMRTADIVSPSLQAVSTEAMTQSVLNALNNL